jgi:hypothetical protein
MTVVTTATATKPIVSTCDSNNYVYCNITAALFKTGASVLTLIRNGVYNFLVLCSRCVGVIFPFLLCHVKVDCMTAHVFAYTFFLHIFFPRATRVHPPSQCL